MRKVILFVFLIVACYSFAQDVLKPFAKYDDSIPEFFKYVDSHDLSKMDGDTVKLNVYYVKVPYSRTDDTWGYIDSDIYTTLSEIVYSVNGDTIRTPLYYLRDYKNKKPTRFALHTEAEMGKVIKHAKKSSEEYWFFQPEKFVISVSRKDGKTYITLKRAHIPQYVKLSLDS